MDQLTNRWMDGWLDMGWIGWFMTKKMDGQVYKQMDQLIDGWTDEKVNV